MKKAFFTCGPFAEILDRVEDFGSGLYFSQLYYDTIMEHQELEVQLSQAKEEDDDLLIKEIERQICFIENACKLTQLTDLPNLDNWNDED